MQSTVRNLFSLGHLLSDGKCWCAYHIVEMDDTAGGRRILGLIPRKNIATYVCSTEYCLNLGGFNLFILPNLPESCGSAPTPSKGGCLQYILNQG